MKNLSLKKLFIIVFGILYFTNSTLAQTEDNDKFNPFKQDAKMQYYNKDGYDIDLPYAFEKVYRACVKAIEENGCQIMQESYNQTDEGLYKGKVFSDYCVFIGKCDTTLDAIKRYSVKEPTIRGGVWVNGRIQYKFVLKELENGNTHLKLKGEISGREDYVTAKVHFWESCGIFEHDIIEKIKSILAGD
ncbi:MAG: hypothetical protein A2X64_11125 [Ignavibacteria bacterium GWF2_33_9]|nr:MAG: hypothetical protein A2X64_11125 [Ignavibacteria bacterium GWF2_33_9]